MEQISLRSMAKINLSLDVLRRREDGYHEVRMIMQTIDLCDTLLIKKSTTGVQICCDNKDLPCDEHNLIYKAVKKMEQTLHKSLPVQITLSKNIPIAAGMAGGSGNAAAALMGLNELFSLQLSMEELEKIAVSIGADVPYCLHGGTFLAEGIGEKLTKLSDAPNGIVVVAKPDLSVSTKFVYENLHADSLAFHPDTEAMLSAIEQKDLTAVATNLSNVLETVTIKEYPVLEEMKQMLLANGAMGALMSGSGPTVFGIFSKRTQAEQALDALEKTGVVKQGFVTEFSNTSCLIER